MPDDKDEIFVSTPEQIAAAKVAQELVETRIKLQETQKNNAAQEIEIDKLKREVRDLISKNNREITENGVLDGIIDKLIDKLAKV